MIISISYIAFGFVCILIWAFLYFFTLLLRFGSDLTLGSEILATIISGMPVLIFLLWYFKLITFTI